MPELQTIEERRAQGRARRVEVPRSSHAGWQAPPHRPDPIVLLEERHRTRVPELVPIRVGRMLVSPFTFVRGAAEVMANNLGGTPTTGFRVQACGDAHLLNFGVFATPERHLVFDVWYERVDVDAVLALARQQKRTSMRSVERIVAQARHHTSLAALPKLTELVEGQRRIIEDPPLILHEHETHDVARGVVSAYVDTMSVERRMLLDRYRIVDAARKVVGVGSVGTRGHVLLLMDPDDGAPLFLQVKEAEESVLAPYAGAAKCGHHGERVVNGQRLMQAASDVFLGWATGPYGHHYYVRRLRDMKGSVAIDLLSAADLGRYATLCGVTLARAYARTGDAAAIAGYLGTGDQFDRAIVAFADEYADQTVRDHAALVRAVDEGRIEAVTGR